MTPRRWRKNGWTRLRLVALLCAALAAVAVCWPGWATIWRQATTQDANGYVLLTPLIVAWLVYARRMRFGVIRPRFDWVGLPAIALGCVLFAIWRATDEPQIGGTMGTILIFGGAVASVVGRHIVRHFAAAWFALLFLNPIPGRILEPFSGALQIAAAELACGVYELLGVSSLVLHGQIVCSLGGGARELPLASTPDVLPMATALILVTYGFVFASPIRGIVRMILLLLAPLAAILGGTLALVATIYLQYRAGVDSETASRSIDGVWLLAGQGLVLLGAFAALLGVMRLLAWAAVPTRRFSLAQGR
ncbi:MAG: archaeosortase/exosortase family protein [Planctomycetota bacterium]